jgi:hypothetical protein
MGFNCAVKKFLEGGGFEAVTYWVHGRRTRKRWMTTQQLLTFQLESNTLHFLPHFIGKASPITEATLVGQESLTIMWGEVTNIWSNGRVYQTAVVICSLIFP